MQIHEALNIKDDSKIISLIGGGGKSTTMFSLAKECSKQGKKILVTTTTHISLAQGNMAEKLIVESQYNRAIYQLKNYYREYSILCLTTALLKDKGKLKGIPKNWIEKIKKERIFNLILVEADGAKEKPFKAPAEHEPVLPKDSDMIIAVMGIEVLGKPITSQYVYRPEKILDLLGKNKENEKIYLTKENIPKIFFHREGILKGVDKRKEVYILINKVDKKRERKALELANQLIEKSTIENLKILIGQVQDLQCPIKFIIG